MLADLLLRALWAVLIASTLLILYWIANRVIVARARGRRLGLEELHPGIFAILYFTTSDCAPCKTVQRPALISLQARLGDSLQVIEVDAAAQPELADYWGVLSVPTTFIIDARGQARRVNHGVASAEKLEQQIEDITDKPNFFDNLKTLLHKYQS